MVDPKVVRQYSRQTAAVMGMEIASSLPLLEPISQIKLKESVIERLLCLHVVAACSYGFDRHKALEWIGREQLADALTEQESRFLDMGVGEKTRFQLSIEGMWALSWALNLISDLNFSSECSQDFFFLMPNLKQMQPSSFLRNQASMRSAEEIIATVDLAYCLHWAIRNAAIEGKMKQIPVKTDVIIERRRALEWLVVNEAWDDITLDT